MCRLKFEQVFFLYLLSNLSVPGDLNGGSKRDEVVELGDIVIFHADTTVGGGSANPVLMVCAMDIDVALVGIGVFFLQSVKAENAGEDEIFLSRGLIGIPLSSRFALLENSMQGFFASVFFADFKGPERGFETAFLGTQSESGGGDRIGS